MEPSALKKAVEEAKIVCGVDPTLDRYWQHWTSGLYPRIREKARQPDALVGEAYLSFNRTLRGFREVSDRDTLMRQCNSVFQDRLLLLSALSGDMTRPAFDVWHQETCEQLIGLWKPIFPLSVGQAQKWLNIVLKYHAAFGAKGAYPFVRTYCLNVLHTPVDNVVYDFLWTGRDVSPSPRQELAWLFASTWPRWSRITEYLKHYMTLQNYLRQIADDAGVPPCAIELIGWTNAAWNMDIEPLLPDSVSDTAT